MNKHNLFLQGLIDGLPICFGYISVAFAFGIFSVGSGLDIIQAVLISATNVTSAGQFAAVPIICSGGTLIELAASQFIINLRYALMSVSLSQKLDDKVGVKDRLIISFVNTDEVFAVASAKEGQVGKKYLYGLILTPFIGWTFGTLLGAGAGSILPASVVSALGMAIYAMFIAIVFPHVKKERPVALCVLSAIILSCLFKYASFLKSVPTGFSIIICAVLSSGFFAYLYPVEEANDNE